MELKGVNESIETLNEILLIVLNGIESCSITLPKPLHGLLIVLNGIERKRKNNEKNNRKTFNRTKWN